MFELFSFEITVIYMNMTKIWLNVSMERKRKGGIEERDGICVYLIIVHCRRTRLWESNYSYFMLMM